MSSKAWALRHRIRSAYQAEICRAVATKNIRLKALREDVAKRQEENLLAARMWVESLRRQYIMDAVLRLNTGPGEPESKVRHSEES